MILRHKRLSAATAGLATLAASLALYATLFSYSAPAYALEQTVQATQHVTSYHAKLSPKWQGLREVWVQLNPDGTPLRARIDYPKTEDGDKVVLFSEGKAAVWFKTKKAYTISPEKDALDRVVEMQKLCDPRLAFEELQARKAAGKVQIETTEPTKEGEFLKLTVTSPEQPNQREVYEVNPTTKLAERVTYSTRKGEQWKETKLIEYLDYNRPIDPKVFEPELPADVVKVNEITRPPGLVQNGESDEAMASKVAREFFEALIAQDYEKAGLIYEGVPAEKIKKGLGELKVAKILEVGEPVLGEHPDPSAYAVKVKVELGARRWTHEFVPLVPPTDDETATKMVKEFFEALVHEDVAAARRPLEAGLVMGALDKTNAETIPEYLKHRKYVRVVDVGKPRPHYKSTQVEVPIRVEVEVKPSVQEFTPYVRPVHNQPGRWTICGGI